MERLVADSDGQGGAGVAVDPNELDLVVDGVGLAPIADERGGTGGCAVGDAVRQHCTACGLQHEHGTPCAA